MKTINFEISKRLNDLWLLDFETEFVFDYVDFENKYYLANTKTFTTRTEKYIKTLTLEEAIEFLSDFFDWEIHKGPSRQWGVEWVKEKSFIKSIRWKTLLEAIEEMLERSINNWLLNKNK